MKTTHRSTIVGITLLLLFFLQLFLKLEWNWLLELQQKQLYKRWSGLGLAVFIVFQWILTFTKVTAKLRKHSLKMIVIHNKVPQLFLQGILPF